MKKGCGDIFIKWKVPGKKFCWILGWFWEFQSLPNEAKHAVEWFRCFIKNQNQIKRLPQQKFRHWLSNYRPINLMVTKEPLNPNTFPTYSVRQLFEPSGKHFSHISDLVSFLSKILGATRCSQTRSAHSCISRKEMLFSGSVNPTRMDNWACSTYSIDPPRPPMHRETMPMTERLPGPMYIF